MPHLASSSHRLATAAVVIAIAAVAVLAGLLARPETLVRFAMADAMRNAAPREARITVSMTGDVVVPTTEPLAVQPTVVVDQGAPSAPGVFAVGDRVSVAGRGGTRRTLEVIDVRATGPARAMRTMAGEAPALNLLLVTCRVLDAAGQPVPGEIVRFLAANEPSLATPGQSTPGTL